MPVVLGDETNLVTAIEPVPGVGDPGPEAEVRADAQGPSSFLVSWIGGLCASDLAMSFARAGSGYTLTLEGHEPLLGSCPAVGIGRGLRVTMSAPIPLDSIAVTGTE